MVVATEVHTGSMNISETLDAVYSAGLPHMVDATEVHIRSTSMDMARTSAFFAAQQVAASVTVARTDDMRNRNGITDGPEGEQGASDQPISASCHLGSFPYFQFRRLPSW